MGDKERRQKHRKVVIAETGGEEVIKGRQRLHEGLAEAYAHVKIPKRIAFLTPRIVSPR